MHDVAALAGVSHITVSRVLNGHPSIRPATRERVLAAIATLPDEPMPYCWRAISYLRLGEADKAQADCQALAQLPLRCPAAHEALARELAERAVDSGEAAWALAVARRAVELSPGSAEAWKSLGLLHVAAGDRGEAAVAFSKAVELAPGDATLRSLLEENARQTTSEEPAQEMHDG